MDGIDGKTYYVTLAYKVKVAPDEGEEDAIAAARAGQATLLDAEAWEE